MAIREYHIPKIMAGVFAVIVLVGCYFAFASYQQKKALRAQEVQAIQNCEEQFKNENGGDQVSFQGVSAERFGGAHIIVAGTAVFTGPGGQSSTKKMNCNIIVPVIGP